MKHVEVKNAFCNAILFCRTSLEATKSAAEPVLPLEEQDLRPSNHARPVSRKFRIPMCTQTGAASVTSVRPAAPAARAEFARSRSGRQRRLQRRTSQRPHVHESLKKPVPKRKQLYSTIAKHETNALWKGGV